MKRRTGLALAVVVILSLAGCFFPEPPDLAVHVPSADYNVTASDLLEEFQQNSVAATLKYQDKTIAVSGDVDGIGISAYTDEPYIYIGGFWSVWCYFPTSGTSVVASLEHGGFVTVVGIFDGFQFTQIRLSDCYLP